MALVPDAVQRGSVVLIRLHRDKTRPAVVVRSDLLSALSYATVLPITTELREGVSMRIDVAPAVAQFSWWKSRRSGLVGPQPPRRRRFERPQRPPAGATGARPADAVAGVNSTE